MAVVALREAETVVLQFDGQNIGIILFDSGTAVIRLRRDWEEFGDDADVLEHLEDHLKSQLEELGPRGLLEWMEDSWSNALRVSERERVIFNNLHKKAELLFAQHVGSERTVKLWALRPTGGRTFSDSQQLSTIEDMALPDDAGSGADLFVVRIDGDSMEPAIPSGSLCLFRTPRGGSQNGKMVLVADGEDRFTIKYYHSEKRYSGEDGWEHAAAWLNPINPEYARIDLTEEPGRYRIVGEFIQLLD